MSHVRGHGALRCMPYVRGRSSQHKSRVWRCTCNALANMRCEWRASEGPLSLGRNSKDTEPDARNVGAHTFDPLIIVFLFCCLSRLTRGDAARACPPCRLSPALTGGGVYNRS